MCLCISTTISLEFVILGIGMECENLEYKSFVSVLLVIAKYDKFLHFEIPLV